MPGESIKNKSNKKRLSNEIDDLLSNQESSKMRDDAQIETPREIYLRKFKQTQIINHYKSRHPTDQEGFQAEGRAP